MSLARSYAQALYDFSRDSGVSGDALRQVEASLQRFETVMNQNAELTEMLVGPSTGSREKVALVETLGAKLGILESARRLLVLMARKERLRWLSEVVQAFSQIRLEHEGVVTGSVVSAEALNGQDLEQVEEAFRKKLGKRVALTTSVDPELLAGLMVTVGGVTYDGTLRAQLNRLKEKLILGGAASV